MTRSDSSVAGNPTRATSDGSSPHRRARRVPYPSIERHGVVGDRRNAALVAADGTVDWLCLPDFDGAVTFGTLLDWFHGGSWRLRPLRQSPTALRRQ